MNYLVIPPYSDPTLTYDAPAGWQVYDLMQAFVEYILAEARASDGYEMRLPASADQETRNRQLLLLAGRQLLLQADHPHRWLRACGAIMSGQPQASAVRLRLDDLEIVHGTTESSADVLLAADQEAPYTPELVRACNELAQAETLRLLIDTDKQLPAAVWLARAFAHHRNVEVSGRFALRYSTVLRRMLAFEHVRFVPLDTRCCSRVVGLPSGQLEQLWWRSAYGEVAETRSAPWGGPVPLEALLEPERLLASAIKVAVVTFTALGATVLDEWGQPFPLAELCHGAMRLREQGVRIVAEWLIGAPTINEEQIQESLSSLDNPGFFDWLAGIRRFHWPVDRQQTSWGKQVVELAPLEAYLDLARSRSFSAADTLSRERLPHILDELARTLMQRAPLSPGRVAGAYCMAQPDPLSGTSGTIRLDPDCAIVQLMCEDHSQDSWFAVNLRLQKMIAMDPRLAKMLQSLQHFQEPARALSAIPEAQRSKVVASLCQYGVLVEATR